MSGTLVEQAMAKSRWDWAIAVMVGVMIAEVSARILLFAGVDSPFALVVPAVVFISVIISEVRNEEESENE